MIANEYNKMLKLYSLEEHTIFISSITFSKLDTVFEIIDDLTIYSQ